MNLENFGWSETWATVLTGFVIVFLALILLIIIFWAFGKVMDNLTKNSKPAAPAAAPAAPIRSIPEVPKMAVEFAADGVSDDVIAAITGAISAILAEEGDGKTYVVRSVKRVRKSRGAWGRAGMEENTRPF